MKYWLHFDQQAQVGDLRRVQIITSNELSVETNLRGPFHSIEDATKIAGSLMGDVVAKRLEELSNGKLKQYATFALDNQAAMK